MGYYINPELGYHEGDAIPGSVPVPQRPDATYTWDGAAWTATAATRNTPILAQIAALEATVSQRRMREAMLGTDGGWLANVNAQIAALRANLDLLTDNVTQIQALNATQLSGLTSTSIDALTSTQMTAFTTTQVAVLTSTQEAGLTTTQIGAL